MTSPLKNSITWSEAKMLTGFATVIFTVAGAWFTIISNQGLTNQKLDNLTSQVTNIKRVQEQTSLDVAKLQQIIDDARAKGKITVNTPVQYPFLTYLR